MKAIGAWFWGQNTVFSVMRAGTIRGFRVLGKLSVWWFSAGSAWDSWKFDSEANLETWFVGVR